MDVADLPIRLRVKLLFVAQHEIDFRHRRKNLGLGLRGAAGDDDFSRWVLATRPADRLPRLPHRLRRHRAGVDEDRVGKPGLLRAGHHRARLRGVQTTAEGEGGEGHWREM
jgi:hypothetical protein